MTEAEEAAVKAVAMARAIIDKYGADSDMWSVTLSIALINGAHARDALRAELAVTQAERDHVMTNPFDTMRAMGFEVDEAELKHAQIVERELAEITAERKAVFDYALAAFEAESRKAEEACADYAKSIVWPKKELAGENPKQPKQGLREAGPKPKTPGSRFYEWALVEFRAYFPTFNMGKWAGREYKMYERLLDCCDGDEEMVKRMWMAVCKKWTYFQGRFAVPDAYPTIGFVFAFRSRIIPMIEGSF